MPGLLLAAMALMAPGRALAQSGLAQPYPDLPSAIAPTDAMAVAGPDDRRRALDCMGAAIAYEAGGQPVEGQQAVGQVILNRMRGARFPKTVCGVVFQGSERATGCQFTFTCDGSFRRRLSDFAMTAARGIAETVLNGIAPDRVAGATHYHADYVLPYWAASGQRVARIGAHVFYRMPGDLARGVEPALLTRAEPDMAALRLAGWQGWPAAGSARAPARPVLAAATFSLWGLPVAGVSQR